VWVGKQQHFYRSGQEDEEAIHNAIIWITLSAEPKLKCPGQPLRSVVNYKSGQEFSVLNKGVTKELNKP